MIFNNININACINKFASIKIDAYWTFKIANN